MHVRSLSRTAALLGALALSTAASVLAITPAQAHSNGDVVRSDLVPSQVTFPAINGVLPGGAPWVLHRGEVRLRDNGRLDVRIKGLQVPNADGTAANPIASIDAVVYCGGKAVADSGPQALSVPGGDARFRVTGLRLPSYCASPTVLISPTTLVGVRYIAFTPVR